MNICIAVDGPAGSGKSSVAKEVAKKLNITYLDSGAMYRCVTLYVIKENVNIEDINQVKEALNKIDIQFLGKEILLNKINVTEEIRSNEVSNLVSKVATIGVIRERLVELQKEIAKGHSIIMDGRDIGTKVLEDAPFKFYLVASVEERAKRRKKELDEKNVIIKIEELINDIKRRDYTDMNREISPLMQAEDAILVDTTKMSFDEVVKFIIKKVGI